MRFHEIYKPGMLTRRRKALDRLVLSGDFFQRWSE